MPLDGLEARREHVTTSHLLCRFVLIQAFKDHKIVDVFHRPGECDLTVNVDFAYLREAAADLGVSLSCA